MPLSLGEARVNDDESIAVGWFALDELPEISAGHRETIRLALEPGTAVAYQRD